MCLGLFLTKLQNRPGAIGSMHVALKSFDLTHRDTIVVGGDTLFFEDFSLSGILSTLATFRAQHTDASAVLSYKTDDAGASKYGILELNSDSKVVAFLEKPGHLATASRWACPCFYVLSPQAVGLVAVFLSEHADAPLQAKDAPGNFVRYLHDKVYPPLPLL